MISAALDETIPQLQIFEKVVRGFTGARINRPLFFSWVQFFKIKIKINISNNIINLIYYYYLIFNLNIILKYILKNSQNSTQRKGKKKSNLQ